MRKEEGGRKEGGRRGRRKKEGDSLEKVCGNNPVQEIFSTKTSQFLFFVVALKVA
jgi:hypothetical protein